MSDAGAVDIGKLRLQWLIGDWPALGKLTVAMIEQHPERAELALIALAGYQQAGRHGEVVRLARLASTWGCTRRDIASVMIAGAHCALASACTAAGEAARSMHHYSLSISTVPGGIDNQELAQARSSHHARLAAAQNTTGAR